MHIGPSNKDIKAARNYLDWTQQDLANKIDVAIQTINLIEKGKQEASKDTLEAFIQVFANENIIFLKDGGFRVDTNPIRTFTGKDAYLKLQEDMINTMMYDRGEIMYLGGDDSKSPPAVIENELKMYKLRIPIRTVTGNDSDYIIWELDTYRQVDPKYFPSDVTVIYGNKVAFNLLNDDGEYHGVLLINNKMLYKSFKFQFENLWSMGTKPQKTTAKNIYTELLQKESNE